MQLSKNHRYTRFSVKLNKCENSINNHSEFDKWSFHLFSTCAGLKYLDNNYMDSSHEEQL